MLRGSAVAPIAPLSGVPPATWTAAGAGPVKGRRGRRASGRPYGVRVTGWNRAAGETATTRPFAGPPSRRLRPPLRTGMAVPGRVPGAGTLGRRARRVRAATS